MKIPVQETIAVDVLIDKLLKAQVQTPRILEIINTCFSSRNKFNKEYISQRLSKISRYQEQLGKLLRLPKVEQRSQEWHDIRKGLVTASEWAQALGLGKFATQRDFYKKKCGYDVTPFNPGEPPLKWGTMYEDVALSIYKHRFGVDVFEFGLLSHPHVKHFGASPDGINDLGVMVEIKCPYRRKITGEVPQQYFYQIQGQLSVCDLHECDYVECEIDEYGDMETWLEVGHEEKGIIIERTTDDPLNPWVYQYSDIMQSSESVAELTNKTIQFLSNAVKAHEQQSVVVRFWALRVFNCVRVYRDDAFIVDRFTELEPIWNKILTYRESYDTYKTEVTPPRKNARATSDPPPPNITNPPTNMMVGSTTLAGYAFIED